MGRGDGGNRISDTLRGGFSGQRNDALEAIKATLAQRDGRGYSKHTQEAKDILAKEPMFEVDKYQGMLKRDAKALREDWTQQYTADMNQTYLDKLRGNVPDPVSNTPVGGLPPEFGGAPQGGGQAPPPMPNGGVPAGTTPAAPTSPWSAKAPQLQVGVTNPAGPAQYDYSHLQQQPLQSAAEKFGGATEQSRALRAGIGSKYSGRG